MFRKPLLFFLATGVVFLWMTGGSAAADQPTDYEISSYVIYVSVKPDGDLRIREEMICSNPSSYEGAGFDIALGSAQDADDYEAWADGAAVPQAGASEAEEGDCFRVESLPDRVHLDIYSPGDNDWRTFACAYTLRNGAARYRDTALLSRTLIPADRAVIFQNAAVIVTLPQSGEPEVYLGGTDQEIPLLIQYDTVSVGPVDVPADESLSIEVLFPAEWLSEADTIDEPMRERIVSFHAQAREEAERETNARKAEQYTAIGVYIAVFAGIFLYCLRRFGIRKRPGNASMDPELINRYPPALTRYVASEEAGPAALAGTLADLDGRAVSLSLDDSNHVIAGRLDDADLEPHERAALDVLFADSDDAVRDVTALGTPGRYEEAKAFEDKLSVFNRQTARDAHAAGLTWANETRLILINFLSILCGVILGFVLILVGKRMLFEACGIAAVMFLLTKLFGRIRILTDEGEKLALTAMAAGSAETAESVRIRPASAVALGLDAPHIYDVLRNTLQDAHVVCASMRRNRT